MDFTDKEKEKITEHLSDEKFAFILDKIIKDVIDSYKDKLLSKPNDNLFSEMETLILSKGGCIALNDLRLRLTGLNPNLNQKKESLR